MIKLKKICALISKPTYKTTLSLMVFMVATSVSFANSDSVDHSDSRNKHVDSYASSVMPPMAKPFGYSLYHMAKITANFNVSDKSVGAVAIPKTPFQILYWSQDKDGNALTTFNVNCNKFLYVPVMYNNDVAPVIGHIPDVTKRTALLEYFYSQKELGIVYTTIKVDGKLNSLGSDYVTGLYFNTPLVDGTHSYMVSAAFLNPLPKGTHTVEINTKATGAALSLPPFDGYFPGGILLFSTTYTVNVR